MRRRRKGNQKSIPFAVGLAALALLILTVLVSSGGHQAIQQYDTLDLVEELEEPLREVDRYREEITHPRMDMVLELRSRPDRPPRSKLVPLVSRQVTTSLYSLEYVERRKAFLVVADDIDVQREVIGEWDRIVELADEINERAGRKIFRVFRRNGRLDVRADFTTPVSFN